MANLSEHFRCLFDGPTGEILNDSPESFRVVNTLIVDDQEFYAVICPDRKIRVCDNEGSLSHDALSNAGHLMVYVAEHYQS